MSTTVKKLLYHFDTDLIAGTFDSVVAYDGGADHVTQLAGINERNCKGPVEGVIYTRAPKDKKNTAIFIGGSDLEAGEKLFQAVQAQFFQGFRVSVMLDSNGCNTTAAAGVALLGRAAPLQGKTAVVLAGTGPVGQRAAVLLAKNGARVRLTSRQQDRSARVCEAMEKRFGVTLSPLQADSADTIDAALGGAHIVFAAAKAGVQLLEARQWQRHPTLELLADVSTAPPLGLEGIDMMDKNTPRFDKRIFGGIGIGALKLRLHRACIAKLFETNDQLLDVEKIYRIAEKISPKME